MRADTCRRGANYTQYICQVCKIWAKLEFANFIEIFLVDIHGLQVQLKANAEQFQTGHLAKL